MTSFGGVAAAFESAVMASSDSMGSHRECRTVNRKRRSLEHALAGAAFGALALGSSAMAADMPLKGTPSSPGVSTGAVSTSAGHTATAAVRSTAVLSDPLPFRPSGTSSAA
jgi:high affinity Mn2+ porin